MNQSNVIDMMGQRFGYLVVTGYHYSNGKSKWTCLCDCGNKKDISRGNLLSGTKSCGCKRYEPKIWITHGLTKHPLYVIYSGIKTRCYNKKSKIYKYYGAKGVKMCKEWRKDFKLFYDWALANGWKKGLQVDKDIKGNGLLYSPNNCSIITLVENSKHKKNTLYVTYRGKTKRLIEWCDILNIKYRTAHRRIEKNQPFYECQKPQTLFP